MSKTYLYQQNATVGSLVIQVRATDEDIGINGAVRYRILKDALGDWQTFSIDEITGAVLLQKPLDRERQKIYEVTQLSSCYKSVNTECKLKTYKQFEMPRN